MERQEYSEAAHLLEAVQQLSLHFQSFAQIPKVAELGGRVSTLQKSLQMNVMREFELLGTGEESTNPLLLERLKACCLVTDALGYKVCFCLQHIDYFRLMVYSSGIHFVHFLYAPLVMVSVDAAHVSCCESCSHLHVHVLQDTLQKH